MGVGLFPARLATVIKGGFFPGKHRHAHVFPDMIAMGWPQPDARPFIEPQPPSLGLVFRHLQHLLAPDPFHSPVIYSPSLPAQGSRKSAVSLAAKLAGQPHDPRHKTGLIIGNMPLSSLHVPMLPKHKTCPAFAESIMAKNTTNVLDSSPPPRGAQKLGCADLRASRCGLAQDRLVELRISEESVQPSGLLLKGF